MTSSSGRGSQVVSIDLGGTTVRGALVTQDGTITEIVKEPLLPGEAPEQVASIMVRLAASGTAERAVVGLPGRVNRVTGELEFAARNLPATDLAGLSASRLSEVTGLEVDLAGDAELAAVGEASFGAGSPTGTTAYLTFSTGVGAAAVADGHVLSGAVAGFQIGLFPVLGPARSALNQLSSGQRIERLQDEIGQPVPDIQSTLALVEQGDRRAIEAWTDITEGAAAAAILMCLACSPEVLVVGGGIARGAGSRLIDAIQNMVAQDYETQVGRRVSVRAALLGDNAGLAGAAAWQGGPIFRPGDDNTIEIGKK